MPRDVMPVMTDRDLSQQIAQSGSFGEGMGGPEPLAQPELDFSRQVIQSMVEGRGRTEPEAITLAGLYGAPATDHDPGADLGMIAIDPYTGHPSGGWYSEGRRMTQIGTGLDPTTALHEIAGHGGLSELEQTGELDYELEGPLGRRLGAALPGTFSNQQFATEKEVKKSLGLMPWEKLPDALYPLGDPSDPRTQWESLPFERSEAFEEQMPTAADWYGMMQGQHWERDPVTGKPINVGRPLRAHTEDPRIDPNTGLPVGATQEGHPVFGQNPFTDEHGGVDALVEAFGPGVLWGGDLPASGQLETARDRLAFYEGRPEYIIEELTKWRDYMKDGKSEPNYITGGGWFDETWTDEDIQNYATEASIRMAPERAFFSGNLSEEMIGSIEKEVGGSEAAKKRLEYYKRDLGI